MLYRSLFCRTLLAGTILLAGPLFADESDIDTDATSNNTDTDIGIDKPESPPKPTTELPLEDLRTFTMVFDHVRRSYVEEVSDSTLLENAITGLLSQLDPHSVYLNEEDFADLQENTRGSFGGIGIEVSMADNAVKVISPIDDTPADRAGIEPGDLIIKIDKTLVKGLSQSEAIDLMRGPKGSEVVLTIIRESENKPLLIDITRDLIQTKSVRSKILEPGYGYIRIAQFQSETSEQFREELQSMKNESDPLKGVVLDLRRNPGGLLPAAIEISDSLLDSGLITYTEGRLPSSMSRYEATAGDMLEGISIVVILDGGSASASEIVAGALQDNKRAIVIGTQSFGKGSVQTIMPISEKRAIKLTTARYFTPSGRSIQAEGITPDIEIKRAEIIVSDSSMAIKEADLNGHLNNTNEEGDAPSETDEEDLSNLILQDNQLFEGLNILKGAYLLSKNNTEE
jgi:carboxyl-terminal processing protease